MSELLIQPAGQPSRILSSDGGMSLSIPIQIKRRSGRKQITLLDGEQLKGSTQLPPPTSLQSALARGYRWLKMLESGEVTSLKGIAALEQVDDRYVSRMVKLTTLAPQIVAAVFDTDLIDNITINKIAAAPSVLWNEQELSLKSSY